MSALIRPWRQLTLSRAQTNLLTFRYFGDLIVVRDEVKEALYYGRPVVALESTIISHGMPYPQNVAMAMEVEGLIRARGVVPATIAVLKGVPRVGLSTDELEYLGEGGGGGGGSGGVVKCSRRDLPLAVGTKLDAATTVAGTMYLAHLAGIRMLVTGGIGGVHRGVEQSMDVSADLIELGRTPVAVVCAGVKSILDIARTLEVLETQGVPVISYGTDEFPAFFSTKSGVRSPIRLDTTPEVAAVIYAAKRLKMENGVVVAIPNEGPGVKGGGEEFAGKIEEATVLALAAAKAIGVKGRDVTPFILKRVNELTGGASLESNLALIKRNATIGAEIAMHLSTLEESSTLSSRSTRSYTGAVPTASITTAAMEKGEGNRFREKADGGTRAGREGGGGLHDRRVVALRQAGSEGRRQGGGKGARQRRVIVVGAAVVDQVAVASSELILHTSNPGKVHESFGGVGRNIAEVLARTCGGGGGDGDGGGGGVPVVSLISCVGSDASGQQIRDHCINVGMADAYDTIGMVAGGRTAKYVAMLDKGNDLLAAVADFEVMDSLTPALIEKHLTALLRQGGGDRDVSLCKKRLTAILRQAHDRDNGSDGGDDDGGGGGGDGGEEVGGTDGAAIVLSDGNLTPAAFEKVGLLCAAEAEGKGCVLVFEPTSVAKSSLPYQADAMQHVSIMTPNLQEALAMVQAYGNKLQTQEGGSRLSDADKRDAMLLSCITMGDIIVKQKGKEAAVIDFTLLRPVLKGLLLSMYDGVNCTGEINGKKYVCLTMGELGVVLASCGDPKKTRPSSSLLSAGQTSKHRTTTASTKEVAEVEVELEVMHYPTAPVQMSNCTGAGDALTAGLLCGLMHGASVEVSVGMGMVLAKQALTVHTSTAAVTASQWDAAKLKEAASRELRPLRK